MNDRRALGDRDELVWAQQSTYWMLPTDQSLDTVDLAGRCAHFGLKVQHDLAARYGAAEVAQQGQPIDGVVVATQLVDHVGNVLILGLVHGDVRVSHGGLDVGVHVSHRNADARLDVEGDVLDGERLVQHIGEPLGCSQGVIVCGRGEQDGELVPAEAGNGISAAQRCGEALGELGQQEIAVVMAEGVVDVLEAIDVQEHDGDLVASAASSVQSLSSPVMEEVTVGEAGEAVVERLVAVQVILAPESAPRSREREPRGHDEHDSSDEGSDVGGEHDPVGTAEQPDLGGGLRFVSRCSSVDLLLHHTEYRIDPACVDRIDGGHRLVGIDGREERLGGEDVGGVFYFHLCHQRPVIGIPEGQNPKKGLGYSAFCLVVFRQRVWAGLQSVFTFERLLGGHAGRRLLVSGAEQFGTRRPGAGAIGNDSSDDDPDHRADQDESHDDNSDRPV